MIGPILGLALIGAAVWFFLRRRKSKGTAPQQGGAAMSSIDPSQPPAGVGGYTDAKPQFAQQQPAFTPDPYGNQGAFAAQQGYTDAPVSPVPQHNGSAVPYSAAGSPPPHQEFYGNDVKYGHTGVPLNGAAELGGSTSGAVPAAQTVPTHHAAELGGESRQGVGLFGPSELPTTSSNARPTA